MLPLLSLAVLALAVSLDGFGVGVMYGLRQIRIPLISITIISLCSGLVIFLSMQLGSFAAGWLSPSAAKLTGAVILIGIGIWAIVQMVRQNAGRNDLEEGKSSVSPETSPPEKEGVHGLSKPSRSETLRTVLRIEMKRLGVVVEILRKPALADRDRSGYISSSEAVLLGAALSLDAFGAGIGAAFVGFPPLATASAIAVASGVFITAGLKAGLACSGGRWLQRLAVLPGCILIVMGLMKLI